jgi:hypothetical protein
MHGIDWERVKNWESEQRYDPMGRVSRDQAESQIRETHKLFMELVLYEILEKLLKVEIELSSRQGPFDFFGLVYALNQANRWDVIMSAWWLVEGDSNAIQARLETITSTAEGTSPPPKGRYNQNGSA